MTVSVFQKARQKFKRSKAEPLDGVKTLPFSSPAPTAFTITSCEPAQTSIRTPRTSAKVWQEATLKPAYIPENIETINAGSIPQWLWPTSHCRAWLSAVLTKDLNFSPEKAAEIASEDYGMGANLYCRNSEYWVRVLGEPDGTIVYARLSEMREKEGAVPSFCHVRGRK